MIFVDISERKVKILKAIIDEYIATGMPIGSRTLSKRPGFDYSPATIRNEMADLEEMGYLEKSHVSSGRMPSDLAYRFYVDRLMHVPDITSEDLKFIKSYFTGKVDALEQVMDMTAKVLSDATHHISMVTRPKLNEIKLKKKEFSSYVACDTTQCRRKFGTRSVKKTLTIPEWLNEAAMAERINFSQVLQDALKEKLRVS